MQSGPESLEQQRLCDESLARAARVDAATTLVKWMFVGFGFYVVFGFIAVVAYVHQGPRPIPDSSMYLLRYFMVSIQLGLTVILLVWQHLSDIRPERSLRRTLKEQVGIIVILIGMCFAPLVMMGGAWPWITLGSFLTVGAILTVFRLKQIKREYLARHATNDKFTSTALEKLGNSP